MTTDWAERGRELGVTLDTQNAIVVAGIDPIATAEVALGIARIQAQHRRVAVGDMLGDAPPLRSLVPDDDPHGLVDSFLFGVSLNRIAAPVADAGELFILPTGSAPPDYDELFAHPRWRRLAAGFAEVGALLVIAAPADAPHLRELVDSTDGVVIVGDAAPAEIPVAQSIAWLRESKRRTSVALPPAQEAAAVAPLAAVEAARSQPVRDRKRIAAGIAGIALALALAAAGLWFAQRPFASGRPVRKAGKPDSSPLAGKLAVDSVAAAARAESLRIDSAARSGNPLGAAGGADAPSDSFPVLAPANAADSASASAYAVRLEQTNTKSGAILDLRGRFETVPAGTYGLDPRTRFFLLVGGAYPTRAAAESLLAQLRTRKILAQGVGSVTSLPFAFLVQADVPAADVPSRLSRLAGSGQPVYALRQPNGAAHLYFGAYESPRQAALAVPSVREAGLVPTLVYRIGRVF